MWQPSVLETYGDQTTSYVDRISGPMRMNFPNMIEQRELITSLTKVLQSNLLKVNLSTLWRWTKDGKLNAYGIGNRIFYKKDEILNSLIKIENEKK